MLTAEEQTGIMSFLGYGNPQANIWFVGLEEGLGGAMSLEEEGSNLRARGSWAPLMDLHEAHLTLREAGRPIDISQPRPGSTTVWMWMARICLAFEGWSYSKHDKETVHKYVRTKLGRREGASFMTELSPVPCAKAGRANPFSGSAQGNRAAHLLEKRRQRLLSMLRVAPPRLLICYGLSAAKRYAGFLECDWAPLDGDWTRGRVFMGNDSDFFLLPFFGVGQMSHALMKAYVSSAEFVMRR